ncbi:hypothetical protein ZWY2020_041005 [Hordeum vulgare]|nr:hypothetical protein ZWY2020_041005 [Hordeum vulgare]
MGPIVTLKVFEDNVVVREFLEEKGHGRVQVVNGGGSLRCSILHGTKGGGAQCCASHPEGLHRPLSVASPHHHHRGRRCQGPRHPPLLCLLLHRPRALRLPPHPPLHW